MKKLIVSISLLIMGAVSSFATDYDLYIEQLSGNFLSWKVSSIQKITFADGNIVLTTTDGSSSKVAISNVDRLHFESEASGISKAEKSFGFNSGKVATGAVSGTAAKIYNVNGSLAAESSVQPDGSVNLSSLPQGIYIVKINGTSFKVAKQ
jgi:hypothetical protein